MSRMRACAAVVVMVLTGAATAGSVASYRAASAFAAALSGVNVQSIAVSSAYARSGVVMAVGAVGNGCKSNCYHLWVSHDRGASWQQAAGTGWSGGMPVIAADSNGKEVIFSGTSAGVQRSNDLGTTWSTVGTGGGNPAVSPSFASDHLVAVAGTSDYTLRDTTTQSVSGSGGTMRDGYWTMAPGFPSTGKQPPVFLGGINSAGKATVESCTTSFACASPVLLPVADAFAGAPLLLPSSAYVQDGTVFAHTAEGLFKSVDGGTTFVPVTPPVPGATHVATAATVVSSQYRETGPDRRVWEAVIAIKGTGQSMAVTGDLYSSTDGGTTWTGVGSPGPFDRGASAVAVASDGRVFAGIGPTQGGGLLCSPDAKTWVAYCTGSSPDTAANSSGGSQQHASGCTGAGCASGASATTPAGNTAGNASASASALPGDPSGTVVPGTGRNSTGSSGLRPLLWVIAAVLAVGSGLSFVIRRLRERRRA